MGYKATQRFSFDGKVFEEGQDIPYTDETVIEKLKERGQIASGKGTSAEDIAAAKEAEDKKKSEAADKQREKEAEEREKEYLDRAGKPKSTKMKVEDHSEKVSTSGPNAPKKS